MEIKIPKEVRAHKETIFFGFTLRQFICAAVTDTPLPAVTMSCYYIGDAIFNTLVLFDLIKGDERIVRDMFGPLKSGC